MKKGLFISLEGGEASGKSTLAQKLKEKYSTKNFIYTREPGGTELGEKIRELLLFGDLTLKTEIMLFAASRSELVEKVIKPNLEKGNIVICDRFIHSSLAYQGYARGFGMEKVLLMNCIDCIPDLTFYLKLDPEIAFKRKVFCDKDNFEKEQIDFHKKVSEGYDLCAKNNDKFFVIDARKSPDEIFEIVCDEIDRRIKEIIVED